MGKIISTIINRFDGGMSNDLRSTQSNKFAVTKHFDTFTYPHKLVPYNATEPLENKDYLITRFVYAPRSGTTYQLYGHGTVVGHARVLMHDIDALAGTWEQPANNEGTAAKEEGCFFYYKGFIYMWTGLLYLSRFDVTSVAVFKNDYQNIAHTTIAQAVHHPADDYAYFFADNVVYRLAGTSWDGAVLTIPDTNLKIVGACAYGTYLAIFCVTKGTSDIQSICYLWDRDSSINTLSERIDFGRGEIRHGANLDGKLVVVMNHFTNSILGLKRGKYLIKANNGNNSITLNEIVTDTTNALPVIADIVKDNKLYFVAKLQLNGDTRLGIWVVDSNGNVALNFIEEEATSYQGIYLTGNMWWISHSGDGSVNRTDDSATFSTTNPSIYESLIFNNGDSGVTKKLIGVTVMTEPLATAGQVVLKYRKNEETAWTTIFTNTTDNSVSHDAVNIESTGDNLPQYDGIQFRIESTGGAVITGLRFNSEVIDSGKY